MKPREFVLNSRTIIFLGKNSENNDELVESYLGKENTILHTAKPGSPFCIINKLNPTKQEIKESAVICASKSQDWRDNKNDVIVHAFTGKDIYKEKIMKSGTWGLKKKPKIIKVKKKEIEEWGSLERTPCEDTHVVRTYNGRKLQQRIFYSILSTILIKPRMSRYLY
ncbi:MAG: NFACT RNA binding domain-containing protein [Candidatus Pacearchaeota archaeon]|nr:NFACT RNA binding domain-containing protein [Candidatus Pacearchaeota archaeon]